MGGDLGIQRLKNGFAGYNGRYFGNLVVIILTRVPTLLRSFLEALVMTEALYFIYLLLDKELNAFLITLFFVVAVPVNIMSQTYGWVSGFSNFCVSAMTVLGVLTYYNKMLKGEKLNYSVTILSLINAFLGTLVLENSTIYLVVLTISVLIINAVKYKKIHKGILLHFIVICTGTIWMFSNGGYRTMAEAGKTGQEYYKEIKPFELSIDWFRSALEIYADKVINYWITPNRILNIVTCIIILLIVIKIKKRGQQIFMIMFSCFLAFFVFDFMGYGKWKNVILYGDVIYAVAVTIYCLTLVAFTAWYVREFKDGILLQIVLWSQLFLMGPLIVANPLTSRCFYITYIFFALYLGLLLSYSIRKNIISVSKNNLKGAIIGLLVFFMIMNIGIYHSVYQCVKAREHYIYESVKEGKKTINLEKIPLGDVYCFGLDVHQDAWFDVYKDYYNIPKNVRVNFIGSDSATN